MNTGNGELQLRAWGLSEAATANSYSVAACGEVLAAIDRRRGPT
jgi:hypothetical protein